VRVFDVDVRENGETFKEYIITVFNYTMKEMALDWCHKYMLKFHDYSLFDLIQTFYKRHRKTQNDEYIYMELNNIKQGET
jgi:hypothetical protein